MWTPTLQLNIGLIKNERGDSIEKLIFNYTPI